MISILLYLSLFFFGIAILFTFYRIIKGPSTPDRILANDVIGVNLISVIAILSVIYQTNFFFDVILILAILAFISTIAYAKFMVRGKIIEPRRDD